MLIKQTIICITSLYTNKCNFVYNNILVKCLKKILLNTIFRLKFNGRYYNIVIKNISYLILK